jgi:hypothetical protein
MSTKFQGGGGPASVSVPIGGQSLTLANRMCPTAIPFGVQGLGRFCSVEFNNIRAALMGLSCSGIADGIRFMSSDTSDVNASAPSNGKGGVQGSRSFVLGRAFGLRLLHQRCMTSAVITISGVGICRKAA